MNSVAVVLEFGRFTDGDEITWRNFEGRFVTTSGKSTAVAPEVALDSVPVDAGTLLTVVFTGATAVATGGIAYGGIKLWKVTEKEAGAASAAREVAELARLRPKLEVHMRHGGEGSSDYATLVIKHLAESESPVIDRLSIEMLNDEAHRPTDGPVWGPWKLKAGADGANVDGRTASARENLERGRSTLWTMEKTTDPGMRDNVTWQREQGDKRSLIRLTAERGGRSWEYFLELLPGGAPKRA